MEPDHKMTLETKVYHLEKKVENHERDIGTMQKDVVDLKTSSGKQEVYVSQIFKSLDDIKLQLAVLQDRNEKDREDSSKQRERADNRWLEFFSKIVYLFIGALIAYLFANMK